MKLEIRSMKNGKSDDIIKNTKRDNYHSLCFLGLSGIHWAHFNLDGNGLFLLSCKI